MHIRNLFVKDLYRPINGVVKADQQDESSVWQELDEYVVTRELDKHFNQLFNTYLAALDNPTDPAVTSRMGVWISGFFGSGKSHFLKILSYLLSNRAAINPGTGTTRRAIDFFEEKLADKILLGNVKRAISDQTDVILFNIDSKADNKSGKDAILGVFLRVFNEMQGFSGDDPHIANMERYLQGKGLLETFHQAFAATAGENWLDERDAYQFKRDAVVAALSTTLGLSEESAGKWFDDADETFKINIEGFSRQVREYLDSKGPKHRVIFLVDEVGQFIGSETHLMLSLQTITEDLGRICSGRAWVIVTSQEDIDAVLGEVRGTKANDFSKIQGRFHRRLSLSSTNTDEVIQARLLEKTGDARRALELLWQEKGDILKNQISFSQGATLKSYTSDQGFVDNYPFAPYHFQLVQKIFESIRKAGATGMHLSRGERSMLDAFQSAAKNIADREIGALVPLYEFYPAIESFLDTIVKKTIEQADDNSGLEPFDPQLLRVLFLIRYVDILKPNIDNLVTLCLDQVDADSLLLKRKIEASLHRLEKENLITSNGDLYFFLTNEERDVSREIKNVDLSGSEQIKALSELIFEEVCKQDNKFRYPLNRRDYGYNRLCDGQVFGSKADHELAVEIITPLNNDDYSSFTPAKCIMHSSNNGGCVVIKLADTKQLGTELRTLLQTEKYIRLKNDAAAPQNLKNILKDRQDQNRERKNRLIQLLEKMVSEADFFALGQSLQVKSSSARQAVGEGVCYLVENIYTKLPYLKVIKDEPIKEITAVLKSNDIGQFTLLIGSEANELAIKEIKQYVDLSTGNNQRIYLHELVERFARRPFGWPEWEVVLMVAKLYMAGAVNLLEGGPLQPRDAIEPLTKQVRWRQVTLLKRKAVGEEELRQARVQGQQLFHVIGPDSEEQLKAFLVMRLDEWNLQLRGYRPLVSSGNYPGASEIQQGEKILQPLLAINDSFEFFEAFIKGKTDLEDLAEDMQELSGFYTTQRPSWDKLLALMSGAFRDNRDALVKDGGAGNALRRLEEILKAPRPYGWIQEIEPLITRVQEINERCIAAERDGLVQQIDKKLSIVAEALEEYHSSPDIRNQALLQLQAVKRRIQEASSIPAMHYQLNQSSDAVETAIDLIERSVAPLPPPVGEGSGKVIPPPVPPKVTKYVAAANFSTKTFLETEADVSAYLEVLRKELLKAVQSNMRVRIK